MITARFAFRASFVFLGILSFLVVAAIREPSMALIGWSESRRRTARTRAISLWSKAFLKVLGFEVKTRYAARLRRPGSLLVANHLSFWDVLAIASQTQAVFVTSVEVRDTPVLGWLCRAGGCIFVERRSRDRSGQERMEVAQALREGASVVLFPEATSTNGSGVLPFKRSFFTSAMAAESPVIPLCINYKEIDGEPVSVKNRDLVFYYGDHEFFTQLAHAFRLRSVKIEIDVLEAIEIDPYLLDREALTTEAYRAVVSRYQPLLDA
jgi:1-acyl-sn-glycerol-3-phosphate acyltransferase